MKLFLTTLVALVVAEGPVDLDTSSLLQTKKSHKDSGEIGSLLQSAASDLSSLSPDGVAAEEVDDMVTMFSQKMKNTAIAMKHMPQTQQEALFRRASQGSELKKAVRTFFAMPTDTRAKVVKAVLASADVTSAFEALPEPEQQALFMQLSQPNFDGTPKEGPKTTIEHTADGKVVTTTNGDYKHQIVHSRFGVETTTELKTGYTHHHKYEHNGRGGNAKTLSESSQGDWSHSHSHSHTFDPNTRRTESESETVSKNGNWDYSHVHQHSHEHDVANGKTITETSSETVADGIIDHMHGHSHSHQHQAGIGTRTETESVTDTSLGKSTHSHTHWHDEKTGQFGTDNDADHQVFNRN